MGIEKIISGAETGVGHGAMEFALGQGIPGEGYCVKGRKCEDGRIPARYLMIETDQTDYSYCIRKNVQISDGIMVLVRGGNQDEDTRYTIDCCRKLEKPLVIIDLAADIEQTHERILEWLDFHQINVLNIAGNKESQDSGICEATIEFLEKLFEVKKPIHKWT